MVPFASCLFDVLGLPQDADSHPSVILDQSPLPDGIEDEDNELGLVLRLRLAGEGEAGGVPLGHAPDCPARQMQLRQIEAVPSTDVLDRDRFRKPRVQIGVVVLIEAHDHDGTKVLVTRRRNDAFIFPSVWVLPGGHAEKGESLLHAGKREVEEETGVVLADEDMRLCGLWESCYPAQVDHGPMKKHHLVVFYRAIVHKPTTDLSLHLQEEEVDGACWVSMAKLAEWIEVEETKERVLAEIRRERGQSSQRDYFAPEVLAAFKQRIPGDHTGGGGGEADRQLVSIRFNHQPGQERKQLGPHIYDMREEWLALGHRFVLKHLLHEVARL